MAKRLLLVLFVVAVLFGTHAIYRKAQPLEEKPDTSTSSSSLVSAWEAVQRAPSDPNAWAELGEAHEFHGQLEAAAHAYRTAIRLGGGDGLSHARLGFLLYARQEDEEALAHLQRAKERGARVPMLEQTIQILSGRTETEPVDATATRGTETAVDAGIELDAAVPPPLEERVEKPRVEQAPVEPSVEKTDGVCSIDVNRVGKGRSFLVPVQLDGEPAELIFDTGASITVVTEDFADRAGIAVDPRVSITAITANGRVQFATALVEEAQVADRVAEETRVAICGDCVEGIADGLLGLDLQAAFGMHLDLENGRINFSDCSGF